MADALRTAAEQGGGETLAVNGDTVALAVRGVEPALQTALWRCEIQP